MSAGEQRQLAFRKSLLLRVEPISLVFLCCTVFCSQLLAQPNIVLIVADDAGYNDFGFMSQLNGVPTEFVTPNLDALANKSIVTSSGYVSAPLCSPSRAGLLSGQYQQRFGYEDNPGDNEGFHADQLLISHQLKNLGYTTGAIGKWHVGEIEGVNRPLDKGFDEFYGFYGGGRPFWGAPATDLGRALHRGNTRIETQWVNEGDESRYDPVKGRYLTDAFGEEAADFINRHAGDEEPFFLYVSLNSPHTPLQAKQQDLDSVAHIADSGRQVVGAMTVSLDRAVGDITAAISANGIDEDTIVVFINDNGGAAPSVGPYDNGPLRGYKGSLWEGGIRVPFLINAPGLEAGIFDKPVTSLDLLPTLVNAAGGNASQIDTDGTDLMPFLSGETAGAPHELMFWRSVQGRFAVRKGDWKLVRPGTFPLDRLHNVADDIDEQVLLNSQHPEIEQELLRELTYWEATLRKMEWGALGASRNQFDHFEFRNDLATQANWSTSGQWNEAGTAHTATLRDEDAYANAVLEFGTRDDADYTTTNNMRRMTDQTFMLNQIRLTGSFAGTLDRVGTINGEPLLFVKSLDGQQAQIRLDATSSDPEAEFAFELDNELQLLDNLEITGDGTQRFVISGDIRDYYDPRSVIKTGQSSVTLSGTNTFGGALVVNDGEVRLDSSSASISGAEVVFVNSSAKLALHDGIIATETLINSDPGSFDLSGGRLIVSNIDGSIENNGGTLAPGDSPALTTISGDFAQNDGVLEIEIGGGMPGTQYDQLQVDGWASLGGMLQVLLIDGYVPEAGDKFEFLAAAGGVNESFDELSLPALESGVWNLEYNATSATLLVTMVGDYNGDGTVNAADYVAWRDTLGTMVPGGSGADGNRNGEIDAGDYVVWKAHFGQTVGSASSGSFAQPAASVPKPASCMLAALGLIALWIPWRRKQRVRRAMFA